MIGTPLRCATRRELVRRGFYRFAATLISAALLIGLRSGSGANPRREGADADLSAAISAALTDDRLRGGVQCVIVESLSDGRTIFEQNPNLLLLPASNQKLLTSAAALQILGPDWRFSTSVRASRGADRSGCVDGDVYLVGSGDPLLDEAGIDGLARQLAQSGVRRIRGAVLGDGSAFEAAKYGDGWSWDDMPYYYSAPVSGLNVNKNLLDLLVRPGVAIGDRARVDVRPTKSILKLDIRATTGAKGVRSTIAVDRLLGRDVVTVSGVIPMGSAAPEPVRIAVTTEEPVLYAATRLTERLRAHGVAVGKAPRIGRAPTGARVMLAHYEGEPLSAVLPKMNKPSDNLIAECLFRAIGRQALAEGSAAKARAAIEKWLGELGVGPDMPIMRDGSGLSRQNFVTGRCLAVLLRAMSLHPSGEIFRASLPVAGVDGTLRNRMRGTPAEGKCLAKTGYVSNVSSLSGYVTTADGEPLLFVILMNNHRCRNSDAVAVQDRIVATLAAASTGGAARKGACIDGLLGQFSRAN